MIIITRIYEYMGAPFEVTRTSPESAKVDLSCGRHDHREFIVGLMEDQTVGWVVGRKEAGYPHTGIFVEAVEHAAGLLVEECQAMAQVDEFFTDDLQAGGTLSNRAGLASPTDRSPL